MLAMIPSIMVTFHYSIFAHGVWGWTRDIYWLLLRVGLCVLIHLIGWYKNKTFQPTQNQPEIEKKKMKKKETIHLQAKYAGHCTCVLGFCYNCLLEPQRFGIDLALCHSSPFAWVSRGIFDLFELLLWSILTENCDYTYNSFLWFKFVACRISIY